MSSEYDLIAQEHLFIGNQYDNKNKNINVINSDINLNENKDISLLDNHINYLSNHYLLLKEIIDNSNSIESNFRKNDNLIMHNTIEENQHLRQCLQDLVNLNEKIKYELQNLTSQIQDKTDEIFNLKNELNYVKQERDENIYQVKTILKEFEFFSNIGNNPFIVNNKQKNRESISSLGTISTSLNFNNNMNSFELDKLHKEKISIENHLVLYKLKYAENTSKIMQLEDEKESYKKKYEKVLEKLKNKEDVIKNLILERDNLKISIEESAAGYFSERSNFKPEIFNSKGSNIPEISTNSKIKKKQKNLKNDTDINFNKIQCDNQYYLNSEGNALNIKNSSKPKGIVKLIKNIFH